MGVSGSGKSTVGELLAARLGVGYADGDDFHSEANLAKLKAGVALDDNDRLPWLTSIGSWLADHEDAGAVVSCSALKQRYRDMLRARSPGLVLLYCEGSRELIAERLTHRTTHFMPASLLGSQFAELEPPGKDEHAVTADVSQPPEVIVEHFVAAVRRWAATAGSDVREPLAQPDERDGYPPDLSAEELAFQRLYGPWEHWSPAETAEVFDPLGIPWWIAGGYAIEAFTGVRRTHEDIDVSIFRRDLRRLRAAMKGRCHVWAAGPSGRLTPLDYKQMKMPRSADQVWLRAHALAPWRADVLLNPDRNGAWVNRRDRDFVAPLTEVTWRRDGIRYLRPEIALAFKAKLARPKDDVDFDVAVPLLDPDARSWLADFLARCEPESPWRGHL